MINTSVLLGYTICAVYSNTASLSCALCSNIRNSKFEKDTHVRRSAYRVAPEVHRLKSYHRLEFELNLFAKRFITNGEEYYKRPATKSLVLHRGDRIRDQMTAEEVRLWRPDTADVARGTTTCRVVHDDSIRKCREVAYPCPYCPYLLQLYKKQAFIERW
ncbi:hypothetical protein EVAR_29333_1 [Eumeta japonica]|uniref:Uncharacterized protein n=1 Tax=Eumeta variegata TaxID=151549 RepID=A0A4C1WKC7_EUMVA|nr:hypothetical protein EVAR_29333_1 [Eumeta japonica]